MRIPEGWKRNKTSEGVLPITGKCWVRYYTQDNAKRGIWIEKLRNNTHRLHHYNGREKYQSLEEAENAAIKWMEQHENNRRSKK